MLADIDKNAVVGTKQVMKAMQAGSLRFVYVAEDADAFLQNKLKSAAFTYGVETKPVATMKELGEKCGIDVGAACAGIRN